MLFHLQVKKWPSKEAEELSEAGDRKMVTAGS